MNQRLTESEIRKIRDKCFENSSKMCAVAQIIIDTCQIVSVKQYSKLKGKHRNTILKQKDKMIGIEIEGRKFVSFVQ